LEFGLFFQTYHRRRTAITKQRFITLPNTNIHALAALIELDFYDSQSIELAESISPLDAWHLITSRPMPVMAIAFRVRDFISSHFGVKKIGGFRKGSKRAVEIGSKLDFFLVEHICENVLTLSERDRHLDVLTCISRNEHWITISSSVITHNAFGRAYMLPVGPAHKLIVHAFLKRLKDTVDKRNK